MAGGAFINMLRVGCFLLVIWGASRLSRLAPAWMCLSSIILEITTGLVMSPSIIGVMPEEYALCKYGIPEEECSKREMLNHVQAELGGCDYDAYMKRDGFMIGAVSSASHGSSAGHGSAPGHGGAGHGGAMGGGDSSMAGGHGTGHSSDEHSPADLGHGPDDHGSAAADHSSGDHSAPAHGSDHHGSTTANHSSDAHADDHASAPADHSSGDHSSGHSSDAHAPDAHAPDAHAADAHGDHGSGDHSSDAHASDAHGDHAAGHSSEHGARRLTSNQKESLSYDSFTNLMNSDPLSLTGGARARRLSGGGGSKGQTKYDSYEDCLSGNCRMEIAHKCSLTPNIFSFIGHCGVALMIFESGMHFDFDKAGQFGVEACGIACLGTFLPLVFGTFMVWALCGEGPMPMGLSAGTALAPTSVGIALKLLHEAGELQKDHGQIILTAAFVDDILSLVLFNCLFAVGAGDISFMTFLPPIIGVVLMCIIVALAWLKKADIALEWFLAKVPQMKKNEKKPSCKDEVFFLTMMLMVLIFGLVFFYTGTHLWGCFMAGMCLARNHHAHVVWVRQTKRMTSWMIRIFFACTVAFAIPVTYLLSIEAFWKGSLMGIGPCILTKVCAAFWKKERFVIGWAMVGRAEFAYLIAQLAASMNMMDQKVFSVVIWSLLYATVFAPFMFRKVLARFKLQRAQFEQLGEGGEFTAEEREKYDKEHGLDPDAEFRQSGHLPVLKKGDDPHHSGHGDGHGHGEKAKSASVESSHHDAHKEKAAHEKAVHSEVEVHHPHHETHEKATLSANVHHNTHGPDHGFNHGADHGLKEASGHEGGAGAKGSGFLCCLFFRKIIIM